MVWSLDGTILNGKHFRNIVSINEYKKIVNELYNYSSIAKNGASPVEQFLMAYYLVGKNIRYDFNEDGESSRAPISHSLKGAMLNKCAVCEGYAEALSQLLNILHIENKCVTGRSIGSKKNNHVWNQVKINGKWYNCDITSDSVNILDGRNVEYCLVSDKDLFLYTATSKNAEICSETYLAEEQELEI